MHDPCPTCGQNRAKPDRVQRTIIETARAFDCTVDALYSRKRSYALARQVAIFLLVIDRGLSQRQTAERMAYVGRSGRGCVAYAVKRVADVLDFRAANAMREATAKRVRENIATIRERVRAS